MKTKKRKTAYQAERSDDNSPAPRPVKGHPQERQHSAATWRDAGPNAPGEKHNMTCVRDGSPGAETPSAPFTTARQCAARGRHFRYVCAARHLPQQPYMA